MEISNISDYLNVEGTTGQVILDFCAQYNLDVTSPSIKFYLKQIFLRIDSCLVKILWQYPPELYETPLHYLQVVNGLIYLLGDTLFKKLRLKGRTIRSIDLLTTLAFNSSVTYDLNVDDLPDYLVCRNRILDTFNSYSFRPKFERVYEDVMNASRSCLMRVELPTFSQLFHKHSIQYITDMLMVYDYLLVFLKSLETQNIVASDGYRVLLLVPKTLEMMFSIKNS